MHDDVVSDKEVLEVSQEGHFYNSKWRHLAEILEDFPSASRLQLNWIPPNARNDSSCPYNISSTDKEGTPYIIMLLTEDTSIEEVLTKLIQGQQRSDNNPYAAMMARNFAHKLVELKKADDEAAQQKDLVAWLLQTKKVNPVLRDPKTGELYKLDQEFNRHNVRSWH